jgi:arginine deiminase
MHRPDEGLNAMAPSGYAAMLFDDIVHLESIRKEHDAFTRIIASWIGPENLLDVYDLIYQVLQQDQEGILNNLSQMQGWNARLLEKIKTLDLAACAQVLLSGKYSNQQWLPPLPNNMFTRDWATVVHDHILVCKAKREARVRETLLSRLIMDNLYADQNTVFCPLPEDGSKAIEGGDVFLFDEHNLFIGHSERSATEAIEATWRYFLEKKVVEHVWVFHLPKERYCMHLDTILTRIDEHTCISFFPLSHTDKMPIEIFSGVKASRTNYQNLKIAARD